MTAHEAGVKTYARTWLALVLLAVASVLIAELPIGAWSVPVALGIALAKALLIVLFFMHLAYGGAVYRIAAGTALAFIVLLVSLMAADMGTRHDTRQVEPGAVRSLLE